MRRLPLLLKTYLLIIYGCAFAILLFSLRLQPLAAPNYVNLGLFIFLGFITQHKKIHYNRDLTQTVVTAILISSTLVFQPFYAVIIAIVANLFDEMPLKKAWFKKAFNTSYSVILFGTISLLIHFFHLDLFALAGISTILGLIPIFGAYALLSATMMGIVVALASGQKITTGLRASLAYLNYYDMSLFPYGLMLAWLWHASPWYFFVGLLPLIAIQRSFAVHAGLMKEQEASARLAAQQRQVQEATTTLLSSKDIHAQLDTLLKHLMEVFPMCHASVLLWGELEEPDQVVSRGDPEFELPVASWSEKLRQVSEARRLVRLNHEYVTLATAGKPVVLVPLVTPDDTVGCLVLVAEDDSALDEQGERLIETFAAQAALAIYQARLIQRLKNSQVQIVQSERLAAIGTLAAGVAHEFNNLLAGISGTAQLALLEDSEEERLAALDTVAKAAQGGSSITRGLLTFARHLEPKRELSDIRAAIEPVLSMLQVEFRRANIQVIRRLEPVPLIECDAGMLAQVMLNLITNAIDAMHPHGGTLTVELYEQDNHIRLAVTDTGCGIPDHIRDRIFEPFVSTKTSSEGKLHGGTGLGLAISYGVVTEHGGTIEAVSSDKGTTMTIRLPINHAESEPVKVGRAGDSQPLRMIVVDDEPVIAETLHGMLTRDGHQAEWYTEPTMALEAMSREHVDVVFADMALRGMGSMQLLRQVKEQAPWATQVVVTDQIDPRQLEQAQAMGVVAVLEKPFSLEEIRTVVDDVRLHHTYHPRA